MITVTIEPKGEVVTFNTLNTVRQLLSRLNLRATQVLVIRDGGLLTDDQKLRGGDRITVKKVISVG